ncbi:amidase domain-containing protein [Naasia sp. SYSU D00948]|uniref:amidase domain-containing protein n=1 Tax=Naasia sp. SYSU D00948 TaxID=2817379 RepID=UPI001B311457|nr:amidase domain-containing protein [Naasia sp. SYSU D00948]
MARVLRSVLAAALLIPALAACSAGGTAIDSGSAPAAPAASSASPEVSVAGVSPLAGPVSGGTAVTVSGAGLDALASVRIGEAEVPLEPGADGTTATFTTPAAVDFAPGAQQLALLGPGGSPVHEATFDYQVSTPVDRQLSYVLAHWQSYNTAEYQTLEGNDCVNFTSQSLVARGWTQDGEWFYDPSSVYSSGAPWRSSTAFRDWLRDRPELAVPLDDTQRNQVVPGDIAQFDWDNSGDRDHTGVVTRVEHTDAGTKIYFAGHTLDSDYRDVDQAITVDHPGGTAYYWHIVG